MNFINLKGLLTSIIAGIIVASLVALFKKTGNPKISIWFIPVVLVIYHLLGQYYQHYKANNIVKIHGEHFSNETIYCDGKHFIDCTFDRVDLVYKGEAPTIWENNTFDLPRLKFEGSASALLTFLNKLEKEPSAKPFIDQFIKMIKSENIKDFDPEHKLRERSNKRSNQ